MSIPNVDLRQAGWEVDCADCGIVDVTRLKRDARKIARAHVKVHRRGDAQKTETGS